MYGEYLGTCRNLVVASSLGWKGEHEVRQSGELGYSLFRALTVAGACRSYLFLLSSPALSLQFMLFLRSFFLVLYRFFPACSLHACFHALFGIFFLLFPAFPCSSTCVFFSVSRFSSPFSFNSASPLFSPCLGLFFSSSLSSHYISIATGWDKEHRGKNTGEQKGTAKRGRKKSKDRLNTSQQELVEKALRTAANISKSRVKKALRHGRVGTAQTPVFDRHVHCKYTAIGKTRKQERGTKRGGRRNQKQDAVR